MSYWVYLLGCGEDGDEECFAEETIQEGGTQVMGGTNECQLNVTWNYSPIYREVADFNLKDLQDQVAEGFIPVMEKIVEACGTERDPDYWAATKGNAGFAISILLGWARQHPRAVWDVS